MVFLALLLGMAIAIMGAVREYNLRSPIFLFYVAVIAIFFLPVLDDYVYNTKFVDVVYLKAVAFADVMLISLYGFHQVFRSMAGSSAAWVAIFDGHARQNGANFLPAAFAAVSLCGFIFGLKLFSISAMYALDWWDLVRSGSPLVILSTYFAYSASALLLVSFLLRKQSGIAVSGVLIGVIWILFATFVLKTRSYVLIFLIPVVSYIFLRKGFSKKIIAIIAVAITSGLFVLARAVRHAGTLEKFGTADLYALLAGASKGTEVVLYQSFLYFVNYDNNFPKFEENITLIRIIFFWVPSSLVNIKPTEFSYLMHSAYFGSNPNSGLSLHPTIFGDAYANSGFLGSVIYALALAVFFVLIERSVYRSKQYVYKIAGFSILSVGCLTIARGAVYNGFMFTLIPLVVVALVSRIKFIGAREEGVLSKGVPR